MNPNRDAEKSAQTPNQDGWVDLCVLADVPEAGGGYVIHNGQALAVFRVGPDRVRVFDDSCPHAGASLSGGQIHEDCVVCPWHAWAFDIETGRCPDNLAIKVRTYPARIQKGRVWIRIDWAI